MTHSFAGRLRTHFMLTLGGSTAVVVIVAACVLLAIHVAAINAQTTAIATRVPELLRVYHVAPGDARAAVQLVGRRLGQPELYLAASTGVQRFIAVTATAGEPPAVYATPRTEPEFHRTALARLLFTLAYASGLRQEHAQIGPTTFTITADDASLDAAIVQGMMVVGALLCGIALFAWIAGGRFAREALKPLTEVVTALEGFADGERQPRLVQTSARDIEFGRLAAAYNRAAERVASSFGERERAEAQIRRFTAEAAHQLRTPLTVIQGFIGILAKSTAPTELERGRVLAMMDRQSRLMASLIEKLLLLGRWDDQPAQPEIVDVGAAVRDIVGPLAASHPAREFGVAIDTGCFARLDPGEIRAAVANVVDNAMKYGDPKPIAVDVHGDGDWVTIVVTDRGPGIPAEERAHAFDRFYRGARRNVGGSGLGLSIAKRATERAGGRIVLEDAEPAGTQVTIALPQVAVAVALPIAEGAAAN
ncbi:MAG TPA: HAMP domain-containing sensor histidine kinase [Candidatus Elarobacter sp.]